MKTRNKLALPLFAALAVAACDGGGGTLGSGTSRVSLRLTDAPGDLAQAWVKVDRVYLQGNADSAGERRVELLSAQTDWVDLLTLSGGRTAELVDGAVVPAGRWSELRMVVCEGYVVTHEGGVYATRDAELPSGVTADGTLHMPSACSSGFKVNFPADSAVRLESESAILTLDFDVSQSFGHQAGGSGRWVMHPVINATAAGFAGGIGGTVALAQGVALPACGGSAVDLAAFVPRAEAGGTTYTSAVGTDGRYRITVPAGSYAMGYAPALSFANGDSLMITAAPSPATATVASGATATVDYSVTAASCRAKA